jgi:hypothetical protein
MYYVLCIVAIKQGDLYENFEKRGVVEKRGEEETKSMPHAPVTELRSSGRMLSSATQIIQDI